MNNRIGIDEPQAIGRRVKSSRMLAGLSRKDLNDKYGISAATLRSWEDPQGTRKGLTKKGALRLVSALSDAGITCTVSWLMTGVGQGPGPIKPFFYPSEQGNVTWDEEESIFKEVEYFKEVNRAPIVALVGDRGMEPYYEKNSYVAGNKLSTNEIPNLIGLNCIVETLDGNIFIRRLQKGEKEGFYTLTCLNPAQEIKDLLISNIALISAAEIVWYRKRNSY